MSLILPLTMVVISMMIIKVACDSFEEASEFLGTEVYKMREGTRGASIEAVAGSLPELFTTAFLLFIYNDVGGYAAGIATCAGSAVFNAVIIPAVCILAVTIGGVNGVRINHITLQRSVILRDAFFFLLSAGVLIALLSNSSLTWWMGGTLMSIYGIYFMVLMRGFGDDGESEEEPECTEHPSEEEAGTAEKNVLSSIIALDFNHLIFDDRPFSKRSAWIVLGFATAAIAAACLLLSKGVIDAAIALSVEPYFTAVILGAAATSVPDTVISLKDARKGDYDDAVSNAIGSNIFDICIALGLPLLMYGLFVGNVPLTDSSSNVKQLQIALVVVTLCVLGFFLLGKSCTENNQRFQLIGTKTGWSLLLLYGGWTGFVFTTAM